VTLIPDWLYSLTPRDEQVTPVEIFNSSAELTANSADIDGVGFVVPVDRIMVLSKYQGYGVPGGAQVVVFPIEVYIARVVGASVRSALERNLPGANNVSFNGLPQGSIFIPGGLGLFAHIVFNSGVAANTVRLDWQGILIPRGNFSFSGV